MFTDKKGREWDTTIDLEIAQRIDASDFSMFTDSKTSFLKGDKTFFSELISNTSLMFAVIWAIVIDQAASRLDIDPTINPDDAQKEFVKGIGGQQIEDARMSLMESLGDFFPAGKTGLLKLAEQFKVMNQTVGEEMEKLTPLMQTKLRKELQKAVENLKAELT